MAKDDFPTEEEADRILAEKRKKRKAAGKASPSEAASIIEQGSQPMSGAQTFVRRLAEESMLGLPSEVYSAYKGVTDPVPGQSRWDSIDTYDLQYESELERAGKHHETADDAARLFSYVTPGGILSGGAKALAKKGLAKAARPARAKDALRLKEGALAEGRSSQTAAKRAIEQRKANAALQEQRNLLELGAPAKGPPPIMKMKKDSPILGPRGKPLRREVDAPNPSVPKASAKSEAFNKKLTQAERKSIQADQAAYSGKEAELKQLAREILELKEKAKVPELPFGVSRITQPVMGGMSRAASRLEPMLKPMSRSGAKARSVLDAARIGQSQASQALLSEDMTDAEKLAALQALIEKQKAEQ
jgi:hypothetical protein